MASPSVTCSPAAWARAVSWRLVGDRLGEVAGMCLEGRADAVDLTGCRGCRGVEKVDPASRLHDDRSRAGPVTVVEGVVGGFLVPRKRLASSPHRVPPSCEHEAGRR